ncbi:hypothetical protein MD484_g2919, partial [Candolleomyces efflorescens]
MLVPTVATSSLLFVAVAQLAQIVSGHGYVSQVVLGSVAWPGYHPYVDPYLDPVPEKLIRKLPAISPIEDLTLIDIQCNGDSSANYFTEPAPLVGTVAAGDNVEITWTTYASDSHRGPLITYMARAPPDVDIRSWMPGNEAVWFKVHHEGKYADGKWAATEAIEKKNGTYTFKIPPNLLSGQYLIRHEWVALHLGRGYWGWYSISNVVCLIPWSVYTRYTRLEGLVYDVWNDTTSQAYPVPGPEVLQCNGDSSTNYSTEPAALVGPVAAGDTVQLTWLNYAGDSHKGPLITYMARAPSEVDIRKWMPGTEAVWFKVHHEGKSEDGKWAATETFDKKNGTYTFTIPPNLLPGQYLIRHEWIALHFAEQYPGAQLYPACVQVETHPVRYFPNQLKDYASNGQGKKVSYTTYGTIYRLEQVRLRSFSLQCNGDTATNYFTEPAPLLGTVMAGDTVQLKWLNHAGDNHKGPLVTYMAKAPSGIDVREWSPGTEAVWFKVHHDGKSKDGTWAAREMFEKFNGTYTFQIPPKLLPGQYLIRHEWIALHFADKYPGFQSYPVCIQVEVTGNGTAFPSTFVSFPGEYTPETPGAFCETLHRSPTQPAQGVIYDVWNDAASQVYPIPGPEV